MLYLFLYITSKILLGFAKFRRFSYSSQCKAAHSHSEKVRNHCANLLYVLACLLRDLNKCTDLADVISSSQYICSNVAIFTPICAQKFTLYMFFEEIGISLRISIQSKCYISKYKKRLGLTLSGQLCYCFLASAAIASVLVLADGDIKMKDIFDAAVQLHSLKRSRIL